MGGDFNQWEVSDALLDFAEITEVITPPTRKDRRIDRVFLNWGEAVVDSTCLPALEAENAAGEITSASDHRVQFVASTLERREQVEWHEYWYRPFDEVAADVFVREMASQDWSPVLQAPSSNQKAEVLQKRLDFLMDKYFPKKKVRRKSDDLPWLNETAKKKIARKRAVFRDEGNSERWHALRVDLEEYLEKRREIFLRKQRDKLLGPAADKQFFKNVSSFKSYDKPRSFNVRDLRPGKPDKLVADEVADFFNKISREFDPLQPHQIPTTYDRQLPRLSTDQVADRLRKCNKPNSMVQGDLFPCLVSPCAGSLAVPLADIYNCILDGDCWPTAWKREYVSTIPKKKLPSDFADLRNISCTLLFSKVFEGFVLQYAMEELNLKHNQYGGVKGCSTSHMLIEIMQQICTNAEDYRSATVITAIDYAKAFNRVSYQHCLKAFQKKSASTPILRLIATFLTGRTMAVKVGNAWSEPLAVNGGCPQGSILGVFLFNVTTEDLEDKFEKYEKERLEASASVRLAPLPQTGTRAGNSLLRPAPTAGSGIFRMVGAGVRHVRLNLNVRNAPWPMVTPPPEYSVGTQVLTAKPVLVFKYVDDNVTCEKLNFGNVPILTDGVLGKYKKKLAVSSQNAFLSITSEALTKGMQVNESKTNLLCVSDSLNFKTLAFFRDSSGQIIDCKDSIKILGFYFSDRTGVAKHVNETVKRVRQKYWVLYHLRRLGFTESELVRVYKVNILPTFDYCCPVYHSLLTDLQDQQLEAAQIGALRGIFGYDLSARKLRAKADLTTLRKRRIELTDKFAAKCLLNDRFKSWFPLKQGRQSARNNSEKYQEQYAKCERLRNSPLFYMRRRLNGKEGKSYGERNRDYRE